MHHRIGRALPQDPDGHPIDAPEIHARAGRHGLQPRALTRELPPVLVDRLRAHAHPRLGIREKRVVQGEHRPA
jgi:hypothetical protein